MSLPRSLIIEREEAAAYAGLKNFMLFHVRLALFP